jgi:hypothetical protein
MGNVAIQYEIDMALADAAWLNEGRPTRRPSGRF